MFGVDIDPYRGVLRRVFDPRPEPILMLTDRPNKRRLFACLATFALSLSVAGNSLAENCGCQNGGQTGPPAAASCGCNQCECAPKKHNCLQKHFSRIASHFKSMLKSKRASDSLCDDGCDAAMIDELMVPIPSHTHHDHGHHHSHELPVPPASNFEMIPPRQADPAPLADPNQGKLKMSEPRIEVSPSTSGEQPRLIPPPVRDAQPSQPKQEGGLFDLLDDPFDDDQTRQQSYQGVRPSAYEQIELRPISRRPILKNQSTSRRRMINER